MTKHICKLCTGRGTQSSGLICICCRGRGFFDVTGEIEQCDPCKGTGRASIKTLPCMVCGGKGFSFSFETTKKVEKTEPLPNQEPEIAKPRKKEKTSVTKKRNAGKEEFGEDHLDDLKKNLTEILDTPFLS